MGRYMEQDTQITSPRLIQRMQQESDGESWECFYRVYAPLLFKFAHSLGLSPEESEDLVQETVVSVSKTIRNYRYERERCTFKSWLFMVVKRRLIDLRRAQSRRMHNQHHSLSDFSNEHFDFVDYNQKSPDRQLWEKDWESFVKERAYALLKARHKVEHLQIFDFSVNKDMSVKEISNLMQISRVNVYLTLHRMRKFLKNTHKSVLNGEI